MKLKIMNKSHKLLCGTLLSFTMMLFIPIATQAIQQSNTVTNVVDSFFPQSLITASEEDAAIGGPEPSKFSDFAIGDLDNIGKDNYIIAVYTNGFSAKILVLYQQNGSYIIVNEPDIPGLSGIFPDVKLINLDNDPKPEVIISLSSPRGKYSNWIFKWTGSELEMIGPLDKYPNGDILTGLTEAAFADLDQDGISEIINPVETESDYIFEVFSLDGKKIKSVDFFGKYQRNQEAPLPMKGYFSVLDTSLNYKINIINGDASGKNRISSASISLNGQKVISEEMLNQNISTISIPVPVLPSNELIINLNSQPGAYIIITIEK